MGLWQEQEGSFDLSNMQDPGLGWLSFETQGFSRGSLPFRGTYKLIVSHISPVPRALASQSHP